MPHWYGVHKLHLRKSHPMMAPQCELLQGQASSPSFHIDHMQLLFGFPLEQWIVVLAGATLGLLMSFFEQPLMTDFQAGHVFLFVLL